MGTNISRTIFSLLFLIFAFNVAGQYTVSPGFLPKINVSAKMTERLRFVNGIETRHVLMEDIREEIEYDFRLTEITSALSYKTGAATALVEIGRAHV